MYIQASYIKQKMGKTKRSSLEVTDKIKKIIEVSHVIQIWWMQMKVLI